MMVKSTQKYGLPYKGSKSTIAEWVISHLPKADTLVDAFAGGCALTHAAMLSKKFNRIIANDITDAPKLFIDACNGLYKDEKRWVSRECFEATKDNDPFVRLIWSFGNNQKNYIYAKDIEERKHAIHNAVHDRKTAQLSAIGLIDRDDAEPLEKRLESVDDTMQRYQLVKRTIIKHSKNIDARCETLERTARLQHLESTARLQHFEITQKDYRELEIPKGNTILLCFDKKTEILTENGWKNIGDCVIGEKCLSRQPETGILDWVDVVNTTNLHYKGKMFQYTGKNVDLCVTPDHKMFVSHIKTRKKIKIDEFVSAAKMFNTPSVYHFISAGGKWSEDDKDTFDVCGFSFDKLKFARLLGIFLTDGTVSKNGSIFIYQSKKEQKQLIRNLLNDINMPYREFSYREGCSMFYIKRRFLPFFGQFRLKKYRKIPKEIKNWGKKYLYQLLLGIRDGDGEKERFRIVIGSKTLVDDIQEIAYKCGFSSTYHVLQPKESVLKDGRVIKGKEPYYQVSINTKKYLNALKNNITAIDYDDVVNCVTLKKWHTVLIRRNGKCIWCGQCDIPYRNTAKYLNDFDHDEFYEWALAQKHPVFICEYDMPTPQFTLIDQTLKNSQLSATTTKKATEKLFACNLTDQTEGQMELF